MINGENVVYIIEIQIEVVAINILTLFLIFQYVGQQSTIGVSPRKLDIVDIRAFQEVLTIIKDIMPISTTFLRFGI